MKRLSKPIHEIKGHYEVVVIGSGYGGSISASRMARAGRSVCLLEKGKEMLPGEFPDNEAQATKEMQMDVEGKHIGSETGLYDFRFNQDINVFQGCGLGGTSLVNANVSLPPEEWVMQSEEWPAALQDDTGTLDDCIELAKDMLKPALYPSDWPTPGKLKAMESAAGEWDEAAFYRPPLTVNFEQGENHVGVYQKACNNCGDCVTGCNNSAKNTTLMNYLPDARNHGAEIFTQTAVDRIERHNDKWLVRYKIMQAGREKFGESTNFVRADIVILGAGTLGTTEILLRSRKEGLALSDMLGQRFTGNGDFLGFGYNNDVKANAVGMGHRKPNKDEPVGPCITGIIDLRKHKYTNGNLSEGMVIEEGVIPGPISAFVPWMLAFASKFIGEDTDRRFGDFFRELWRRLRSFVGGAYRGAVGNTMTYLVMTHDDGKGALFLKDNRVRIDWDGVGKQSIFGKVSDNLKKITKKLGGTYVKNPTWNKLFKHRLTTVHPLGGCIMSDEASGGVVNHKGQVFSASTGTDVHEGLYVSDGSLIPRTLGVNPLLTISALAERNCKYIAEDRGWTIDYRLNGVHEVQKKQDAQEILNGVQKAEDENTQGLQEAQNESKRVQKKDKEAGNQHAAGRRRKPTSDHEKSKESNEADKPGIQFTERMTGYFSAEAQDYQNGYEKGEESDSPFSFVLTIKSHDIDGMIRDPKHRAAIVGTVQAPALSGDDLSVSEGVFNLFVEDPEHKSTRHMRYRMKLHAEEGEVYYFDGFKRIHDDPGFDIWEDTTTLFITIHEGENKDAPVFGRGILKIRPNDLRKQMTTLTATGVEGLADQLKYRAKFVKFFSENIVDIYI